jgi:predicted nucleic acid-binding protein
LLGLFEVAPVDRDVLDGALDIDFADYEDAVLHESARAIGATAIVTRDRRDFANSAIPALDPQELLAAIATSA